MTKIKTRGFTYSRSEALVNALNRLWEDDKKNKDYSGSWTLTHTVRNLMFMAYKEFDFLDLSKTKDGSVCRIPVSDIHLMSPKLNDSEPNAHYGRRLIWSALIQLGYKPTGTDKSLQDE